MRDTHITPSAHDEDLHTTRDCWCSPVVAEIPLGLLRRPERVHFHRRVDEMMERESE